MVVGEGFEPSPHDLHTPDTQCTYEYGKGACPLIGPLKIVQSCPHLAEVVKVWDSLDEASRKAILQLVKASAQGGAE